MELLTLATNVFRQLHYSLTAVESTPRRRTGGSERTPPSRQAAGTAGVPPDARTRRRPFRPGTREEAPRSRRDGDRPEHRGRQPREVGGDEPPEPGREDRPDSEAVSTSTAHGSKCDGPSTHAAADAANAGNAIDAADAAVSAMHTASRHAATADVHDDTAGIAANATCDDVNAAVVHGAESIWRDLVTGRGEFF